MADNNFRTYRGRDAAAPDDIDPRDALRDPLAELARLIGQGDPVSEFDRNPRREPALPADDVAPAAVEQNWPDDQGYAEPNQYAEDNDVQPQLADPYPAPRDYARYARDDQREQPADNRYAEPAERFAEPRDAEPAYQPRYRENDAPPPLAAGRRLPALPPQSHDDEYETDDEWHDEADDQSYAAEEYDDDSESRPRRSGLAAVMAVAGLVIVGAASAFAYHAMFGGTLLPALPPIIKANDGPNKIVPAPVSPSSQAGGVNSGGDDKLVSREEQPVPVQPSNPPPRVIATIPVLPAPSSPAPAAPPLAPVAAAPSATPVFPPAPPTAPATSTEPKKVHTVLIKPDQPGTAPASAPPSAAQPKAAAPQVARPAPAPKPSNAPLAIVPVAQGTVQPPAPPRTQVARAEPAPVATAPATVPAAGGYAVQVTSQRSEAEAKAAFQAIAAKFPKELGSRAPIIRRADLGDKGTYYRAMVGPFASAEAAASMCSSLKAAGGSCLVQRD